MIQTRCPHCSASVSVPESAAGTVMPCPECKQSLTIPPEHEMATSSELPANRSRSRLWPIAFHACAYAILAAVSLAGWFMPAGPEMVGPAYVRNQYHDVLTANRVQVVDGKGDLRIMLRANDDGGSISVFDKMGARYTVAVGDGAVSADFMDAKFNKRVRTSVEAAGNPKIVVSDTVGKRRVELTSLPSGGCSVALYGHDGKVGKEFTVE